MKIFGVFDPDRGQDELANVLDEMRASLNHGSYSSDVFVDDGLCMGRMYFDYLKKDTQPIWNEDKTRFILMVGDIFDYEQGRRELEAKGHEFKYGKSHAEFVLHGLEEWGRDLIRELNGFFVFLLYDTENRALTIVNDRYGLRPLYYYFDNPFFIFASEVKAIIRDGKVPREIDWDGWHDIFSYKFLMGTKTLFRNVKALDNAVVVTVDVNGVSSEKYWRYDEIKVDHESSLDELVDEGVRFFRQAVERQTRGLRRCVVPLSGGMDSRGIVCAIKKFTEVDLETFTHLASEEDEIFGREVADHLNVKNAFIPRPRDLIEKYLVDMVYLNDGMRILIPPPPTSMLLLHYAREGPEFPFFHFMGLASPILWGWSDQEEVDKYIRDDEKLARYVDKKNRQVKVNQYIDEFFLSPVREKMKPRINSLLKEFKSIGEHENKMMIWGLRNWVINCMSRYANNILSLKTTSYFPYLENDFVEYSLSIPPLMKQAGGIRQKIFNKLFRHHMNDILQIRIMKKLFPEAMKISSTRHPVFSRYYLSTLARSKNQKKKLLQLFLHHIKHYLTKRRPLHQIELTKDFVKKEFKYMFDLLKSLRIPPFIDRERLLEKTLKYLRNDRDPSYFLIPLLEFCIWYNLFIFNIPASQLVVNSQAQIREDAHQNKTVLVG